MKTAYYVKEKTPTSDAKALTHYSYEQNDAGPELQLQKISPSVIAEQKAA